MTTFAIDGAVRTATEKPSEIRQSKRVPWIVYGKTQEPISFTLDSSDFLRLHRKAWESNIINLKVGKVELEVLVHQTQKHPVTGAFTHVDFYAITRGEVLTTNIQFNFINEAPAVKEWFVIEEVMKEVEVKCLPRNLTDHFDVDLSTIKSDEDSIKISDLGIDTEKFELSVNQDDVVVACSAPKVVVDEDPVDEEVTGSDEAEAEAPEDAESEEKA